MKDRILYQVIFLMLTMVSGYAYADNTEDDTKTMLRNGRTWVYASHRVPTRYFPIYFFTTTVAGDTLIDGEKCKIMESSFCGSAGKRYFIAAEKDGRIYGIDDNGEKDYKMDFSANVGDLLDNSRRLSSVDEIEINGRMHRRFTISSASPQTTTYWIEGIGMSNNFVDLNSNSLVDGSFRTLVEVWDNGEKIFTAEQFTPEKTYDDPYGETVREDRIWNYDFEDYLHPDKSAQMQCAGYHFDGTIVIDGKKYAMLRTGAGYPVAYMREKDGRVYEYLHDNDGWVDMDETYEIYNINNLYTYDYSPSEFLMYDFTGKRADTYMSPRFFYDEWWWFTTLDSPNDRYEDRSGFPTKVIVNGEATATLRNGEDARLLYLSHDYGGVGFKEEDRKDYVYDPGNETMVIEGIGPDTGRLHLPEIISSEAGFGCFHYILNSVTDTEGNVIFERKDFGKYNRGSNVNGVAMAGADITVRGNAITATLQGSGLRITVYSPDGLMIASEDGLDTVEISGLPAGIYLVEAKTSGNTLKKKIIIR